MEELIKDLSTERLYTNPQITLMEMFTNYKGNPTKLKAPVDSRTHSDRRGVTAGMPHGAINHSSQV